MRLIDADALIKFLGVVEDWRDEAINKIISNYPTVDAVPVVRCGDCENFKLYPDGEGTHVGQCLRWMVGGIDDDEYCSYGERRNQCLDT